MKIDKCHLMIDLETLGTKSNAVILSVGAVLFDLEGNIEALMHRGINIDSCLRVGLEVDGGTIEFWLKQSKENIDKLMNVSRLSLNEVLNELAFLNLYQSEWYIWSHGSNFDTVLLENAYKAVGQKVWWKYNNVRDTRTLFDLANYKYVAKGGHDALDDARNQAKAVCEAYLKLKGGILKWGI